jgi:hypothetical protein
MRSSHIEALKREYEDLVKYLSEANQPSFIFEVQNNYRKALILSAASYFEATIINIICAYVRVKTNSDEKVIELVKSKALNRQYHSLFNWEAANANRFFSFFGDETKQQARTMIGDGTLKDAEEAFMSIGRERNKLVHQNYVEAIISSTFEELYAQYELASEFISLLKDLLPEQ